MENPTQKLSTNASKLLDSIYLVVYNKLIIGQMPKMEIGIFVTLVVYVLNTQNSICAIRTDNSVMGIRKIYYYDKPISKKTKFSSKITIQVAVLCEIDLNVRLTFHF